MKTGLDAFDTAEKSPGTQNMKTGPDALGTIENEYVCTITENGT
jgi:hypothetical protein